MKIFRKFGCGLSFILAFAVLAIAQTEKEQSAVPNKVVFIASEIFEDEEKGIKELVDAYAKLSNEFKPQKDEIFAMVSKYNELMKEYKNAGEIVENAVVGLCYPSFDFKEKAKELDDLSNQIKEFSTSARNLYIKRKSEVINPIKSKIQEAMKQFAKEKGYEEILDVSNLELVCYPRGIYVTNEFIKYYNSLAAKQQ